MANPPKGKAKATPPAAKKPAVRSGKTPTSRAKAKPVDSGQKYVVSGTVTYTDSAPATGLTIIAYDKDVSGKEKLGQTTTDAAGNYIIRYSDADFRHTKDERGGADVMVCVYNDKQELLFTSKKKNNAPAEYELNIKVPAQPFVVRGTVTDANHKPLANLIVRAFDRDLRNKEPLGKETRTNQQGHYEIPYTRENFTRAEKEAADIVVRIYEADSEKELMSSEIVFNAPTDQTIDLQLPKAEARNVSAWERMTQEASPLLVNQGKNGEPLLPRELDEKDIDFIVKESGLDREQLRLWALADKFAHDYELIQPQPLNRAKRPKSSSQTLSAGSDSSFTGEALGELIERICFFGWFLNDQPQKFDLLVRRPTADLLTSLDRAISQNHIPPLNDKLKAIVSQALELRRVVEEIKPSAEGEPASFGDVLNIAVGNNDAHRAMTKRLAPDIHRLVQAADIFSADFVMALNKTVQKKTLAAQIANSFRLSNIAMGHKPLLEMLGKKVSVDEPAVQVALMPLAGMDKLAWVEVVYRYGVPQASSLAPEQYAEHLHAKVEEAAPVAVLMHVLQTPPLFTDQGTENQARVITGSRVSADAPSTPQAQLYKALKKHPTIDIMGREPAELARVMGLDTDASGLLGRLTHLKRLDMRWDEAATLMERSLNHVGLIIDQGYKGFAAMLDEKIAPHRIDSIWQRAKKTQAMSIGLMGYLQPMLYGTGIAVKESHRNVPKAKKLISENPTLAKLFGSIDNCYCDPCRSVLSPAAYLADLLKFIDYSKDVLSDVDAGRVLRSRRPDVFDLELSCDNSKVELPHIDLVNEILENAIALPFDVVLPPDMDPADELGKPHLEGAMLAALQSTSTDSLSNLTGKLDPSDPVAEFGVSNWVVSDRFRRWTLTAADEYLGLRPMNHPGINLKGVDRTRLFRTLSQNGVLDPLVIQPLLPLFRQSFGMYELPLEVTAISSRPLDHDRRWKLAVTAEGSVTVVLGATGVVKLIAPKGRPNSRIFQQLHYGTSESIARSLDAGNFPRELRNLCGIVSKADIAITKTGPLSWRYSITLDKIQLVYRPSGLRITGIAYQSSDAGKDLMLKPQNRNPLAYDELDSTAAVFPWTLPYDAALQEARALLDKASSPRLGWLSALTPADRRTAAPAIMQELLGLSHRQYELITTEAVGNKRHWGLDARADLVQLRKVSEVMRRARVSFAELQVLMDCAVVNPGRTYAIDMQDCCDPALMLITGMDNGFPGLLDRLHRFVRLWRVLGWDANTLDGALNPMLSATPALNEDSLITLAHFMAISRLLNVEVSRLCDWFSPTISSTTATRPARELQLAQALGLGADEYTTARQVLTWALAVQAADFPFSSAADLRSFVDEIQFVKTSGQSWSVLGFTLLHSSPDIDALDWTEARTRLWLTTLHSQSALPLPEAIAVNTTETPEEIERRWLGWGLGKLPSGKWSVANPDEPAQQLVDAEPLQLLSRIDVLGQQTGTSEALLKVCLLSPAVDDPQQAALSLATAGGVERVNGLRVEHLDRLQRVISWLLATKPLATLASLLAQEADADPSVVEELLNQPLSSNTAVSASLELLQLLLEHPMRSLEGAAAVLPYQSILMRVHKLLLLNTAWQGKSEHLRWLKEGAAPRFAGLQPLSLPVATVTTGQVSGGLYRAWKQTTTLLSLARISTGLTRMLEAYLHASPDSPALSPTTFPRWAVLAEAFCLVDASGAPRSSAVGLLAQQLGDTPAQRLDPLWLNDLCGALALAQRFGANRATTVENIIRIGAARPNNDTVNAARMLLQRLGDEACKETLSSVENKLREERRDRLVDFLLWRERDHLRDVNALYEHYLIDPQMSSCMNTTRLLQATAAAQLFVHRCLMNLENHGSDPVPPSLIDTNRWEWARNYRVWEANRKVFLYPENWLFPEVRDDRSETFRTFESAMTQSEPSYENGVKALQQYLGDLVEVSQIGVVGMYEKNENFGNDSQNICANLYLVGRTKNPPHSFFWRKATNYREQKVRWTGWEKINLDLSEDHLIPFVFSGNFYLAWPLLKQIERDGQTYYQLQMAWAKHTETGWTKREVSREYSNEIKKPFNRDARSLFTFRVRTNPLADSVDIDAYVAEPKNRTELPPSDPNKPFLRHVKSAFPVSGDYPWSLRINLSCFVKYSSGRIARVTESLLKIDGLQIITYVYAGDTNNRPYKNYGHGPLYRAAAASSQVDFGSAKWFYSANMVPGTYNLTLKVTAYSQLITIPIDQIVSGKLDLVSVDVNVLFENVAEVDADEIDETAPLVMKKFTSFTLSDSEEASWQVNTTGQIDPPQNSYSWSSGFRERGAGGIPFFKPGFPENMLAIPSSSDDTLSAIETWYVEEGSNRMFARLEERHSVQTLTPASYTEAALYKRQSVSSLDLLFNVSSQEKGLNPWFGVDSINSWVGTFRAPIDPRDNALLNFDLSMPYAGYNWEVFYQIPIAVATFLSRQHRFEDARRWFHFIFDPTTNDASTGRERFWRFLPFRQAQAPDTITQLLEVLAKPQANVQKKSEVEAQIAAWLDDPFNPFAIARLRPSAFEWYTVISYIKNLIAWADQMFRRDTRESINEATLLYVMAAQILGPRPEIIRTQETNRQSLSYRSLKELKGDLDSFSNVWLTLADTPYGRSQLEGIILEAQDQGRSPDLEQEIAVLSSIGSLYFCVPPNEKFPELWDMVDDRLFKIRHCQNIEGVRRELALYEPPIDPELLIRAKAAGMDWADVLADRFAPLPHYRFQVLLQKANEFCNEVKNLGGAILSAIEKKEAEQLSLLRSSQEIEMLKLIESIKKEQIKEAQANIDSLGKTKRNAIDRFTFLQHQLGKTEIKLDASDSPIVEQSLMSHVQESGAPNGFHSLSLIHSEIEQVSRLQDGHVWSMVAGVTKASAGIFHTLGANPINLTWAPAVGHGLSAVGDGLGMIATNASFWERRAGLIGGWQRRRDEWVQQSRMTAEEIRQIDKQIIALEIRKSITEKELDNHRTQIEHASNIDDFLRHIKFSGESIYGWMESQIAGLYFSAYQMAYDLAKKAERAYQFELGDSSSAFVQFGHWDSLRKGLLSGERLSQNLRRMEVAHLERNRRELEITKHVSLRQLNPQALLDLRRTGRCEFSIPELLFDLDFPGHYFRRIKSASVSAPCVVGPYVGVTGTLRLVSSKLRDKAIVSGNYSDEPNYKVSYLPTQAIATSTGQNDSGLFELNFRDERYLPFEGAGAISNWEFELPTDFKAFDYSTISDLILHVRYTARDGGQTLATAARGSLVDELKRAEGKHLVQLISVRQDFPQQWAAYRATTNESLTLTLTDEYFPYLFRTRVQIAASEIKWYSDSGLISGAAATQVSAAGLPLTIEVTGLAHSLKDVYALVIYKRKTGTVN